ncbi:MAG: alpha-galactosidase, partial [Clostridia bacterium]|nr:alpha-galactosidase [Clostridia bacterium]
ITTIDAIPQECPSCGRGDYRSPAVIIENEDGRTVSEFKYLHFKHYSGVPVIEGLPQLDKNTDDVETLELVLKDTISGVSVHLYYSVFEESDIIARHMRINNCSGKAVTVRRAMSASFDLEEKGFEMISLAGRWACERSVERLPLRNGKTIISSSRGATGHNLSPFAALARNNTDEDHGEVYAMTLVYSGSFEFGADVGQFGSTRFFAGIDGESFSWKLQNEEEFVTPQALLTYSAEGLGKMSHNFHNACRGHLGVCSQNKKHPVLLNLWEAFYFDVTEEAVIKSIRAIRGTGIDTVVLDDGWFGKRVNDESSLGDWFINKDKFPGGFEAIISECRSSGLKFGLWFEPEMISEDSELYRKHPDWCIKIDGITPVKSRNELVLDMSRPEVVDALYKQISRLIRENGISYIKWDMNRNITDCGSVTLEPDRQGEHSHRYILGVYSLMERLTKKFPNVFFEGCAGGGGRFDFGILYYMPQIWASDNSDAIARLKIQYGTSMVFPPETMSAHISDCPNHQTGRITPISTRGNVAQLFSFGYEFDPSKLTLDQRRNISDEIARHRAYEGWIG